jgi:hypothetical protein
MWSVLLQLVDKFKLEFSLRLKLDVFNEVDVFKLFRMTDLARKLIRLERDDDDEDLMRLVACIFELEFGSGLVFAINLPLCGSTEYRLVLV